MPAGSPPLMVVLEAKGAGTYAVTTPPLAAHDTVAIAGLNAVARAKATFQPRARPYIGNAATLLGPNEAYVVKGTVYYIDGFGTVWTMGADGKQSAVSKFPIGLAQQEVSFAVSPDGCQLVAAVLTVPSKGPPASGAPFPTLNGTWKLETMQSVVGGAPQLLHAWSSSTYPDQGGFNNLTVVGWDAGGPIVVIGAPLGTQAPAYIANPDFFGGTLAHLDAQGVPGPPISTPACSPIQVSARGDITCVSPSTDGQSVSVSVLSSSGQVEVQPFTVAGMPDVAVGAGGLMATTGKWQNGSASGTLPANFQPEGWIDSATIFGRIGDPYKGSGDAALAHLRGGQASIEDLRFVGDFVGMLS
jgi:hypothetical protein